MISKKYILFLIIVLIENTMRIDGFRVFDVDGVQTILALKDEDISIVCKASTAIAYCGFIHPSGKRYSFSGLSLINGQCAVKIKATTSDSGQWRCHIGKRTIGVEVMQNIQVRVVDEIAAVQPNMTAVHGKDVTLACVSTKGLTPLSYCRFEPPNGSPFSIDSAVKPSKAILDKYYYPQNMSLDRGDCAVTIRKVKYSDVGAWTCGAGFDDGQEHTDVIKLDVEGLYTMTTASTSGITFGVICVIGFLVLLGFVVWKKRSFLGTSNPGAEGHEMGPMGSRPATPGSQRSEQGTRNIPAVVVHSPSEPSSSLRLP